MQKYFAIFSNLFFIQLFFAQLLYSGRMLRKRGYIKRLFFLIFACEIISVTTFVPMYLSGLWIIYNTLYYFIIFLLSLMMLNFLFDESIASILLCATSGYLTQNITAQIVFIISNIPGTPVSALDITTGIGALFSVLFQIPIYLATYILFYELFGKKTRSFEYDRLTKNRLLVLSMTTLLVTWIFSSIRDSFSQESLILSTISRFLSIQCCLSILYLRIYIIDVSSKEKERALIEQLYYQQKKRYEIGNETINLINEKCHDLKHQLAGSDNYLPKAELKELISIYDSTIRTGNQTLDNIFAQKTPIIRKYGIRLSPLIDGGCLEFMEIGDICSIFGNILDNAIEAVMNLENEEDRIISIKVQKKNGMIIITTDNYYNGSIILKDGLPMTKKDNISYHGFGLKSIKRTAKKYGGTMSVIADDMFHLVVMIPVQNS